MLQRRQFLKAAGGFTLALPWLESIGLAGLKSAHATSPPLRYVHIYFGTGWPGKGEDWFCSGSGDDFQLGPWLREFEPYKQQLTQIRNLRYNCGPHTHFEDYLSGYPDGMAHSDLRLPAGAPYSVDQVIADAWAGQGAEMHSLVLGSDIATKPDPNQTAISWRVGAPVPRLVSPSEAFDSLFNGPQERARDRSILDLVREQAKSLEMQVSVADRQRLDQYQTALRDIEQRIAQAEKPLPDEAWKPAYTTPDLERPVGVPADLREYHAVMLDIALLALKMDKTRVVTCMITNESSHQRYDFLDKVRGGLHDVSHGDGGGRPAHAEIVQYFASQCARFVRQCAEIDEGDGTLLDHSLIHYSSSMSEGGGHNPNDIPQLLIGGAHGRHKGARIITPDPGTHVGNANLGVMQMLGLQRERFGEANKPVSL